MTSLTFINTNVIYKLLFCKWKDIKIGVAVYGVFVPIWIRNPNYLCIRHALRNMSKSGVFSVKEGLSCQVTPQLLHRGLYHLCFYYANVQIVSSYFPLSVCVQGCRICQL